MKTKISFLFFVALIFLTVLPLTAQTTGPDHSDNASPTHISTSGRFNTAIDEFIQPADYTNLRLQNWFAYISFAKPGSSIGNTIMPRVGFAKKIKSVYLALYYSGTMWGGLNDFGGTEETITNFMGSDSNKKVTSYATPANLLNPDNTIALLFGFMDMGLRLSYTTTRDSFDGNGSVSVDGTPYNGYEWANGYRIPQIKWAMAKDLTKWGLRPYLTFDIAFYRDSINYNQYIDATNTAGTYIHNSQNYIGPKISLGAGAFTFYRNNYLETSTDLDYTIHFKVYNNDYSYLDESGKYRTASIDGKNTNGVLTGNDYLYNCITPSASVSWSHANIKFKAKLKTKLEFENEKSIPVVILDDGKGTQRKNGDEVTVNIFTFTPQLDLGAQYKIGNFTINIGGLIERSIARKTINTKVYDNQGNVPELGTKSTLTDYGVMTNRIYLGVGYAFTNNIQIDAITGIGGNSNNDGTGINVFDTGMNGNGLFNFASIALSMQF